MSSYLGAYFDPMPTLQEDDELVPLSTILTLRRGSLREFEVWAVCRECCLALRSVSKSSVDLFKKLCLTPDTLTFNAAGSVSFSDSGKFSNSIFRSFTRLSHLAIPDKVCPPSMEEVEIPFFFFFFFETKLNLGFSRFFFFWQNYKNVCFFGIILDMRETMVQ